MTSYAHYTNEELITLVYSSQRTTPLELELAFRLEHNYADGVTALPDDMFEEPTVRDFEDIKIGANT